MGRKKIFTDREMEIRLQVRCLRYYYRNREKIRVKVAEKYATDPEFRGKQIAWRAANIEKLKKQYDERRRANQKEIQARQKEWVHKNKDRVNAKARAKRKEDPARFNATMARFRERNPLKARADKQIRRAREKSAPLGDQKVITRWEKSWKSKRTATCYWCQGRVATKSCHTDHVVALANGGAHAIDNLCISCTPCNLQKGAKPIAAWNTRIAQPVLL